MIGDCNDYHCVNEDPNRLFVVTGVPEEVFNISRLISCKNHNSLF